MEILDLTIAEGTDNSSPKGRGGLERPYLPMAGDFIQPGKRAVDLGMTIQTAKRIRGYGHKTVITDIEGEWPYATRAEMAVLAREQASALNILRKYLKAGTRLGCFGLAPMDADTWRVVRHLRNCDLDHEQMRAWVERNEQARAIAARADIVCPGLYATQLFWPDWQIAASAMLLAARKYGKPVYPFVCWRYTAGGYTGDYAHRTDWAWQYVSLDMWRSICRFVSDFADGCVVWGGGVTGAGRVPWTDDDQRRFDIVNGE